MSRLLREPLLHFLLLGALLFAAYGWLKRDAWQGPQEIVVDQGRLDSLSAQFERVWQRPPSAQDLDGLIQTFVREEIFYREGLAMGLDRDDPVVRRRIGQKMAFIADGLAPTAPTEAELQAWLDAHPDDYTASSRPTPYDRCTSTRGDTGIAWRPTWRRRGPRWCVGRRRSPVT